MPHSFVSVCVARLERGESLTLEQAMNCMKKMLSDSVPERLVLRFLSALFRKGETAEEIVGVYYALRSYALSFTFGDDRAIDICGTGGVGKPRFNVSTAAAFVASAEGVKIAKFGNRGSSFRSVSGSVDILEALGILTHVPPRVSELCMQEVSLLFFDAGEHYPVLRRFRPARSVLEHRTIFNLVGPLLNPADPKFRVLGTTDKKTACELVRALHMLGYERALVIVGHGGVDELTVSGPSLLFELEFGETSEFYFDPRAARIRDGSFSTVGDEFTLPAGNAVLLAEMFARPVDNRGPLLDTVALNAGAALYVGGLADSIEDGLQKALMSIMSRNALKKLDQYRSFVIRQCSKPALYAV